VARVASLVIATDVNSSTRLETVEVVVTESDVVTLIITDELVGGIGSINVG
jgi:hypothetical protein